MKPSLAIKQVVGYQRVQVRMKVESQPPGNFGERSSAVSSFIC